MFHVCGDVKVFHGEHHEKWRQICAICEIGCSSACSEKEKEEHEAPNKAKHSLHLVFLVIYQTRTKSVKCGQRQITAKSNQEENGRNW